jgi:hypothetical protein
MDGKTQGSFAEGWNVFYQARTVFGALLIIAMLANLGVFFAARFGGMTEPAYLPVGAHPTIPPCTNCSPCSSCGFAPKAEFPGSLPPAKADGVMKESASTQKATTTAPVDKTASAIPAKNNSSDKHPGDLGVRGPFPAPVVAKDVTSAMRWYNVFENVMNMTAIVTMISVFFMVFCALLGIMMLAAGQLPGADAVAKAFFWAIAIVAFILPWDTILPQVVCLPIGLANFFDIQQSLRDLVSGCDVDSKVCHMGMIFQQWVKFVVIPVLVILIDIAYLRRTSQANKLVTTRPQ